MHLDPQALLNAIFFGYFIALIGGLIGYQKWGLPPQPETSLVKTASLGKIDFVGMALLMGYFLLLYIIPQLPVEVGADGEPSVDGKKTITAGHIVAGMMGQIFPGIIVLMILLLRGINVNQFLGLRWKLDSYLLLVVIAPAGLILTYTLMFFLDLMGYTQWMLSTFGDDIMLQDAIKIYQQADEILIRSLLAISIVVVAPVVEEIVFRGYIYSVTKRFTARLFSTLISAVLFAVVHNFIPGMVPLAFLAILLTISYEITGSLWAPISMHALFNATTLAVQEYSIHHSH